MITDKCCNSTHPISFHLLQLQVKMHLIVNILVSVLLPKAYSLKCFECTPGQSGTCTDKQIDCPNPTQCDTKVLDVNAKSCAVPTESFSAA
ncbi:unnamed protein product, partial [Coregonus sp. 'balchen']